MEELWTPVILPIILKQVFTEPLQMQLSSQGRSKIWKIWTPTIG